MGLFDGLYFNQNSYGGQGGGLLDFLRTSQMQQSQYQPSQGFGEAQASPIAIGDYQMPRIGPASQFASDPAAIPQNAQAAQGQLPMTQPESSGGLGAGFSGIVNNLHAGPLAALIGGIGSAAGYQSPEVKQANQTAQYLVTKGYDPALAKTIVSDPTLLRSVLPQVMGVGGQTDDIKEFEYAKKQGFQGSLQDWMQRKRGGAGEYGLQPIWGVDKEGNPAVLQLGKSGESVQSKIPEGFKIAKDPIKVEGPTETVLLDPQTRQVIGKIPKDLKGAEIQRATGEAQGKAITELPGGIKDAEQTTKKIDELLNNEGLDSIVGPIDQFRPSWTLGDKGRDALARYNQLKGTAFLQAFGLLRGGGAITEIEGAKAEAAMARMDRAQSETDFRAALKDFRDAVQVGVQKLKTRAGVSESAPASAAAAPTRIRINADGTIAQ